MELTYPTLGKENHLQNAILGGYVSSLEGTFSNHFSVSMLLFRQCATRVLTLGTGRSQGCAPNQRCF